MEDCITACPLRSGSAFGFLRAVTVWFFWSSSAQGIFGACYQVSSWGAVDPGAFGGLSTAGLFGSSPPKAFLERFTILIFESPLRFDFLIWNSTMPGTFGVLNRLAPEEFFTILLQRSPSSRRPGGMHQLPTLAECITSSTSVITSGFVFLGAIQPLLLF